MAVSDFGFAEEGVKRLDNLMILLAAKSVDFMYLREIAWQR
jgi:hypothetical protein